MRRKSGLILLALAVFFAALSPLLRWYAFPRLAKIPANQYTTMVLEAKDATLLDYDSLQAVKVPKVTIVQTLKGNVEASEKIERTAGRDVVVWDGLSYVQGPDGKMVSKIPERYIFDAHTQEPVHATGEMVDGDPVKREGIEFKWPFLVEKRDYEYFDAQARVTAPIHYKGTQDLPRPVGLLLRADHPLDEGPLPRVHAGQGHHRRGGRRDRHHPLVHHGPQVLGGTGHRCARLRRGDPPGGTARRQAPRRDATR